MPFHLIPLVRPQRRSLAPLPRQMQRIGLTLSKRVWKPHRPLRIGWNRGYAEQPKNEKLFWDNRYNQDTDPTPRRTPVYVGAGLIAIGVYYLSRRKVHAESPARTTTRRTPGVYLPSSVT